MKKNSVALIIVFCLALSACAPSEQVVQAALAQTQAAQPTGTPSPTASPTKIPCSDRGWEDIALYLHQFDQAAQNVQAGTSIVAFLDQLGNTKDKINEVDIDACSEHARQLIISGLANEIYASENLLTGNDIEAATQVMIKGVDMIKEAKVELEKLGIILNYP